MAKAKFFEKGYLFFAGSIFLSMGMADRADAQTGHVPTTASNGESPLQELADVASAITQQMTRLEISKPRPKALQFYTSNCPFCYLFDQVVAGVKEKYVDKVDFEMIDAGDPKNAAIVARYGVTQVPSMMCVNPEGEKVTGLVGYLGTDDVNSALFRLTTENQQANAGH